jgi:BMFP domain-containing protein YqiC
VTAVADQLSAELEAFKQDIAALEARVNSDPKLAKSAEARAELEQYQQRLAGFEARIAALDVPASGGE